MTELAGATADARWRRISWTPVLAAAILLLLPLAAAAECLKGGIQITEGVTDVDAAGVQFISNNEGGARYLKTFYGPGKTVKIKGKTVHIKGPAVRKYVPYNDSKHNCTVGHGYKIHDGRCTAADRKKWTITEAEAQALLNKKLAQFAKGLDRLLERPATQKQYDAMLDLAYNAGLGRAAYRDRKGKLHKATGLIRSGVVQAFNSGDNQRAAQLFLEFVSKSERKSSSGLVKRRQREYELFLQGSIVVPCPQTGVQVVPVSSCTSPNDGSGGVDSDLYGEFFGQTWASGEVTATASDGAQPESAEVGYDYISAGHFGPWPCGTDVKLTATPSEGNHFDKWVSDQGLCATSSTTCTVAITPGVHEIDAYFAPTIYQLTVNSSPDAIVTSGSSSGGYVHPGIDCGSVPNGPTIEAYTQCSEPAVAQRSDTDLTQLYIGPDRPGPGGKEYDVQSVDGCDSVTYTNATSSGGTAYHPSAQCYINMTSDRSVTATYAVVPS